MVSPYQMGCDEGSEDHIWHLTPMLKRFQQLKSQAGQVPESWLLAIVIYLMADEVASAIQSQPASSPTNRHQCDCRKD